MNREIKKTSHKNVIDCLFCISQIKNIINFKKINLLKVEYKPLKGWVISL